MDLGISDKVALVTGASGGLGFATAEGLLNAGARVAICSRNSGRINAARDNLGSDVAAFVCDLSLAAASFRNFRSARLRIKRAFLQHPPRGEIVIMQFPHDFLAT
jgi:3-oxoacyl-[acyl-carrier protein] reductase